MESLAKFLIFGGLTLALIGGLILVLPKGFQPFQLPGDIAIEKPGFSLYFPLTTMALLSGVLWLATWVFGKLKG